MGDIKTMKTDKTMNLPKSALLFGSLLLLTSCASTPRTALFDPPPQTAVPENTVVYKFSGDAEKNIFREMHPAGSSIPEIMVYGNIHIATWLRPSPEGTQERVTAVWTTATPTKVSLKTSGSISGFYDANGKQLRQELFGNYIRVSVSKHLLYLVGSIDLEVEIPEK